MKSEGAGQLWEAFSAGGRRAIETMDSFWPHRQLTIRMMFEKSSVHAPISALDLSGSHLTSLASAPRSADDRATATQIERSRPLAESRGGGWMSRVTRAVTPSSFAKMVTT